LSGATVTSLSPERAALRARNVGASEAAALFGLHPYLTKFRLWNLKAGRIPADDLADNERVEAGIFMEPSIAAWVKHRTGWPLTKVERYCEHPTVKGMGCSPDYEFVDPATGELVTVQIKNVDAIVFAKWEDGPPMVYQLQVQHEIACGPYARGVLAVNVGGNRLELFRYDPHAGSIARLEKEVADFWRTVEADEMPDPDFSQDLDTIESIYSLTEPGDVRDLSLASVDPEDPETLRRAIAFADACRRQKDGAAQEKAGKELKDAAKAEILTLIDTAAAALTDGFKVSTWNVAECPMSYTRSAYRGMKVTELSADKPKKGRK